MHVIRFTKRNPGFATIAVISLAIGIGASTAIFSLVNAFLLRPLPVYKPQELVALSFEDPRVQPDTLSYAIVKGLKDRQQVFAQSFAWFERLSTLQVDNEMFMGDLLSVSGSFYQALGIAPAAGRLLNVSDDKESSPSAVAVISYDLWQRKFGGSPDVPGRVVKVDGIPYTVVGVTPKGFFGLKVGVSTDITIPLTSHALRPGSGIFALSSFGLNLVGRLKTGAGQAEALAQLQSLWPSVVQGSMPLDWTPERRHRFATRQLRVVPAATGFSFLRQKLARPLRLVMGMVLTVLLLACLNLATLMMARYASRQREIGTRLALGAGRWKLVRESAAESLSLSAFAAVLGLTFAYGASRFLADAVWTGNLPLALDLRPDMAVLCFTAAVVTAASFVFGVVPTVAIIRHDLSGFLHRGVLSLRSTKTTGKLVIALQVGLSTVLVMASLLFARSLERLSSEPTGYDSEGVLDVQLMWQPGHDKTIDRPKYYRSLLTALENLPDVEAASISLPGPVFPYDFKQAVSCGESSSEANTINANPYMIGPHFFSVLGIPILQGRDLSPADDDHSMRVALLSKSLAQRCFPSSDPIGKHIRVGDDARHGALQVIGIVADANLGNLRQKVTPTVYLPFLQEAPSLNVNPEVELRTYHNPQSLRGLASDRIRALGQEYLYRDEMLTRQLVRSLAQERVLAVLATFFGSSSLLLVCIGMYGLMSYSVRQRSTELGIRMAIGARRQQIIAIVLKEALLLTCLGLLSALPAVLLMKRVISGLLFDLRALDPLSIGLAAALMFAAAATASFLPARRASRIEPIQALRHE